MKDKSNDLYFTKSVVINGKSILMEVDLGAAYSIISKHTVDILFAGKVHLFKSNIKFQTYSKENLTVLGELIVDVTVDDVCILNLRLHFI